MKKIKPLVFVLSMLLCLIAAGCSGESASSVIGDAIPENITRVEASGYCNGELEAWELTQAEIEELNTWIARLSLKRRTYAEDKTPNRVYNGGVGYTFDINGGELSFTWSYIDKAYIFYDGEWYEITNSSTPPLGLPGPGKPGK